MNAKKLSYSIVLLLCLTSIFSCKKPPIYNNVPTLEFIGFTQDTVQQSTGTSSFIIGFTDGDGDLGSDENGVINLFIIDDRINDTMAYRIPTIPKQGVSDAISGEIEVDMANFCCIPTDIPILCFDIANTYQNISYRIYIVDNAGNISNEVSTTPIQVRCFVQ